MKKYEKPVMEIIATDYDSNILQGSGLGVNGESSNGTQIMSRRQLWFEEEWDDWEDWE